MTDRMQTISGVKAAHSSAGNNKLLIVLLFRHHIFPIMLTRHMSINREDDSLVFPVISLLKFTTKIFIMGFFSIIFIIIICGFLAPVAY